jgi:hypothetical protein
VSPAQGSFGADTCIVGSSTHLPAQDRSGHAACHRLRAAPGVPCVTGSGQLWGRHVSRGLQHPPPGAGQLQGRRVSPQLRAGGKNVRLSSSEIELLMIFFSIHRLTQGSSRGSVCPRGSRTNENRRDDAEDLAESSQCKATPIRSKRNRTQGRRPTATESILIQSAVGRL